MLKFDGSRRVIASGLLAVASSTLLFLATASTSQLVAYQSNAEDLGQRVQANHLPNALRVTSQLISGGLPEGEEAFCELRDLGIKTIISVDGAKPDVELATRYGMRYVHLPHGYDGIPEARGVQIAKAVRDLPGPIYLHCHHGKHRSPAASMVAALSLDQLDQEQALTFLKTAGTNPQYRGLYESVRRAKPCSTEQLNQAPSEFPAIADLPKMAEAMVEIEHRFDQLKKIQKAGLNASPLQAQDDPAHLALILREHYTELLRTDEVKRMSNDFVQSLTDGEKLCRELEEFLSQADKQKAKDNHDFAQRMQKVSDNCVACHRQFRDVPLSEKNLDPADKK